MMWINQKEIHHRAIWMAHGKELDEINVSVYNNFHGLGSYSLNALHFDFY